jgi:transcriptional regulator with GAF, ATPase, and Fis domain
MNERLPEHPEIATGLTELAALMLSVEDVEEALRQLARMAVVVIPDGPSCGITVIRDGRPVTVVYAGSIPASVHEAQFELGEGPCLEVIGAKSPVVTQDLTAEHRWPKFCAAAQAAGAHGVYAHPLEIGGEAVGVLSLYAHERNMFPEKVQQIAMEFVEPAALLLGGVLRRVSQTELIAQLRTALSSRAVIDQAIGIIMARRRCGPAEALGVLRKISNDRNIKLREVAASLVSSVASGGRLQPRRRLPSTE